MTTTNEVMRLIHIADDFAVATGRNLTGEAFQARAALRVAVEALVAERDALRLDLEAEKSRSCGNASDCIHQPLCGQAEACMRVNLSAALKGKP